MKHEKKYFHELPQSEVDSLIDENDRICVGHIIKTYSQPEWCGYKYALSGVIGCWSLMDLRKDGLRTQISQEFCGDCELHKANLEKEWMLYTQNTDDKTNPNIPQP